jgi:prepilin-type processing-associated H-X9-DG protein
MEALACAPPVLRSYFRSYSACIPLLHACRPGSPFGVPPPSPYLALAASDWPLLKGIGLIDCRDSPIRGPFGRLADCFRNSRQPCAQHLDRHPGAVVGRAVDEPVVQRRMQRLPNGKVLPFPTPPGNAASQIDEDADAAWLDTVWAGCSGATSTAVGFNGRVQTACAKHARRANVIYVDGHSAASHPSRLTWGRFWGVFTPMVFLRTQSTNRGSGAAISKPQTDPLKWFSA